MLVACNVHSVSKELGLILGDSDSSPVQVADCRLAICYTAVVDLFSYVTDALRLERLRINEKLVSHDRRAMPRLRSSRIPHSNTADDQC